MLVAVVVLAAPWIGVPIAYGFTDEPEKFALFVEMFRITFPYLLLISLAAFCSSILNSYQKFAVPAFTPALLNISLIGSSFLLAPHLRTPELALAWGTYSGFCTIILSNTLLVEDGSTPETKIKQFTRRLDSHKRIDGTGSFLVSR